MVKKKGNVIFKVENFQKYRERFKGIVQAKQKKNLYYSFNCDETLHTNVKSKIKLGNRRKRFSIFSKESELFTKKNVKKGVRGNEPNGRAVQPTQLILILVEAEFCALQNFFKFYFSF